MRLNNKGFAITGILYTVFVLFLMILLSVLGGLSIKRQLLEKNMENIKTSIEEECYDFEESPIPLPYKTLYAGKYVLAVNGKEYTTYLDNGVEIKIDNTEILFIGDEQLSSLENASVIEICTTDNVE